MCDHLRQQVAEVGKQTLNIADRIVRAEVTKEIDVSFWLDLDCKSIRIENWQLRVLIFVFRNWSSPFLAIATPKA